MQHFVPRVYLRNFGTKIGKDNFTINIYDKTDSNKFVTNIKKIAVSKYFYDTDEDVNQEVEKELGSVEGNFNTAYEALVESKDLTRLTEENKQAISNFVATQLIRTMEYREGYSFSINSLKELLSGENMTDTLRQELDEVTQEDAIKENHISMIKEFPQTTVPILNSKKWVLIINNTEMMYNTSDHPITLYNPEFNSRGIDSPGIQIFFPLNPTLCLTIVDPIAYGHHSDKIISKDVENSKLINYLQVARSHRFVFSKTDDFSVADDVLNQKPEFRESNRKRGTWQFLDNTKIQYTSL